MKSTTARQERRPNTGQFRPGLDPRRHQFTQAERSRGFWTAIATLGVGAGEKLQAAGRWPGFRRAQA